VAYVRNVQVNVDDKRPWWIAGAIIVALVFLYVAIDPRGAARQRALDRDEDERERNAPSLDRIPWPPPAQAAHPTVDAAAESTVVTAGGRRREEN
jgi:NADH-quinone oxidoreductase subunit H